jgi:cellulase
MTCYQLTVTGSGTLEPKGVTFPEAYTKTGTGLGFSIHADLDSYPAPGPELIEGGTEVTPSLLTFGKLAGAPAATATGAASKAPASTAASVAASSTAAVEATSSAAAVSSVSASSSVVVEATFAVPVATSAAVETPSSSVADPVEAISTPPAAVSSAAPFPVSNSTSSALPGTASPIRGISSAAPSVVPTTMVTAVRPTETAEASGPIKEYYQCGGQGFTSTAKCADGLVCKEWNPWYSQCVEPEASQPGPSKGPMPTAAAAESTSYFPIASAPRPTATYVAVEPSAEAPKSTTTAAAKPTSAAVEAAEPTSVAPAAEPSSTDAPAAGEKTYTLETFIAFLEQEAGSASAAKIRRMIEALQ